MQAGEGGVLYVCIDHLPPNGISVCRAHHTHRRVRRNRWDISSEFFRFPCRHSSLLALQQQHLYQSSLWTYTCILLKTKRVVEIVHTKGCRTSTNSLAVRAGIRCLRFVETYHTDIGCHSPMLADSEWSLSPKSKRRDALSKRGGEGKAHDQETVTSYFSPFYLLLFCCKKSYASVLTQSSISQRSVTLFLNQVFPFVSKLIDSRLVSVL